MQQAAQLYISAVAASAEPKPRLGSVETGFIHNWAGLARAFGMDPMVGRVHALAFLSAHAVRATEVAETLDVDAALAAQHLDSLARWGALRPIEDDSGETVYEADGDPWSWFLITLKERGKREFAPLLQSIREANARAQQLRGSLHPGARHELHRIERIARFSEFVEQIAGFIETFATLGAGPMVGALRMMAKVRGPRLVRI